jgi:hypothetical protein
VISVDTKKKELLGEFKNAGSDYGPKGQPIEVDAHDFENKQLGKVVPYGVYDVGANSGYVSLGIDHDTAQFAVNAARRWLDKMGRERYPATRKVMVTADCGGSNGPRLRLWKVELQRLANETGLTFQVCHYPPGTSKWNKACPREGGDRAPHVLPHYAELARYTAHQPHGRGRTHRQHLNQDRPDRPLRT